MVLHFKRWVAVMKEVGGKELPLVLFNVTDMEEAKEEVRKRLRARVAEGVFNSENTDPEGVEVAERASGNEKRKRVFFIATIDGNEQVVAEVRQRNK